MVSAVTRTQSERVFLVRADGNLDARPQKSAGGSRFMPFLADLTVALAAALAHLPGGSLVRSARQTRPDRPTEDVARAVGDAAASHPASRGFVARRLDRTAVTGLLLTTALAVTFLGVLLLGVLALPRPPGCVDPARRQLGRRVGLTTTGARPRRTHCIWVTDFGSIQIVVGARSSLLVVVDFLRHRNRWCVPLSPGGARRHGDSRRFEQAAAPGEVLIGASTHEAREERGGC